MLREIRDLGFALAELSHGIRISLLPGIFEAVDSGEIKISSVHNFCPLPMGVDRALGEPSRGSHRPGGLDPGDPDGHPPGCVAVVDARDRACEQFRCRKLGGDDPR
jgi:hypothetical protein